MDKSTNLTENSKIRRLGRLFSDLGLTKQYVQLPPEIRRAIQKFQYGRIKFILDGEPTRYKVVEQKVRDAIDAMTLVVEGLGKCSVQDFLSTVLATVHVFSTLGRTDYELEQKRGSR